MNLINDLQSLGVNTDEALKRFMNNASLYERMLGKLPKNVRELEVMPHLTTHDYDKALQNAHTLKGVMGNLSVTPLYIGYADVVTSLRANNPQQAIDTLNSILPIQDTIISRIESNS
jgi:HPt (histidine-containing phosphotransfer) domain-containing protein